MADGLMTNLSSDWIQFWSTEISANSESVARSVRSLVVNIAAWYQQDVGSYLLVLNESETTHDTQAILSDTNKQLYTTLQVEL